MYRERIDLIESRSKFNRKNQMVENNPAGKQEQSNTFQFEFTINFESIQLSCLDWLGGK